MSEAVPHQPEPDDSTTGGQVSEAGSGLGDPQTAHGGADAVPDTPDSVPADEEYTD